MKFSILLNSRERPTLLKNLLESIRQKTNNLDEVEVLIGCDTDDLVSELVSGDLQHQYPFCRFYWREREHNLHTYINFLYKQCSGKYILGCNDDIEILTQGWDDIVETQFESFLLDKPDRIVYGQPIENSDDRVNEEYAAFPFFSREAIDALGFVCDERWPAWGADLHLGRIYRAIDRVCMLTDIRISHVLHIQGKQGDHLRPDLMKAFMQGPRDYQTCDISEEVNKLRSVIVAKQ